MNEAHHFGGDQSVSVSMSLTNDHSVRTTERPSVVFTNGILISKVTANGPGGGAMGNDDDDDHDDEAAFIESVEAMTSTEELQRKFIEFYRKKEAETYDLKHKFTEISRRQKEVFVEVENKRKMAVQKGKKYKERALKLHNQATKHFNELKAERKRVDQLNADLDTVRSQKKQKEGFIEELTKTIHALKSSLNQTEQSKDLILDEFKQTHGVIGRLIENEKTQQKLKCYIEVQGPNGSGSPSRDKRRGALNTNLSVATLKWHDPEATDRGQLTIQWNRSYFTELIPIKNANRDRYQLSADDIGSIIKVEVRSKDNPDCFETAVLKHGPIRMHSSCIRMAEDNLVKIQKQHIEFVVTPDLSESNTAKLLASHLQSAKSQDLILHFNKDKVKLRTHKNATIEKREYNDLTKMTLSAMNPKRFSLRLSQERKYVFMSKSPLERDHMAILLRCYIEKLKVEKSPHGGFQSYFYLRSSNERTNSDLMDKLGGNGETLTRKDLISNILAPISSRRKLDSLNNGVSPHSITGMLMHPTAAPVSNDPSLTNDIEIDVDSIFPDFHNGGHTASKLGSATTNGAVPTPTPSASVNVDEGDVVAAAATSPSSASGHKSKMKKSPRSKGKESKEKREEATSRDIEFDEEEKAMMEQQEQQEKAKKVWKGLEFVEDATIASDRDLKQMAITPAPMSRGGRKGKSKKRKRANKTSAETKKENVVNDTATKPTPDGSEAITKGNDVEPNKVGIALTEEVADRIDCELSASGEILKYQVVGNLTLKYKGGDGSDLFVEGTITNLDMTKTKVFSPHNTEKVDQSGRIRVKVSEKEKSVEVLKYVWSREAAEEGLPFLIRMNVESLSVDGAEPQVIASFTVTRNHADGVLKELLITGCFNEGMTQCLEHSEMANVDFFWSQHDPEKFMWSLKDHQWEQECKLVAKFGCKSEGAKTLKMKMQFEIKDCGISSVQMKVDPDAEAQIVRTERSIRGTVYILK